MNLPGIEPASSPEGRFFEFIFMIKILIYSCYSVRIFEKCFSSKKSKWIRSDLCIWKIRQILIFCHWKFSSFDLVRITRDKSTRTDIIRYKLAIIRFQLVFRWFSRLVQKLFRNSSEFQSFFVHESFKRATLCHLIVRRNHTRK